MEKVLLVQEYCQSDSRLLQHSDEALLGQLEVVPVALLVAHWVCR